MKNNKYPLIDHFAGMGGISVAFLVLSAMLMSACAPRNEVIGTPVVVNDVPTLVTPAEPSEVVPSQIPTTISIETAVPTEVIRDETMDKPLNIISSFPVENVPVEAGAVVNGSFDVDKTAIKNNIHEVSMPEALGGKLLLKVAAWLDWFHGNNPHTGGDPTDQDIADFAQRLAKVQSGELPCSEVQSTIFAFDANQPGSKMEEMKVALFCGKGDVPEGVRRIDKVEIVYMAVYVLNEEQTKMVAGPDWPRFTIAHEAGSGFETTVDDNILRIMIGVDYLTGLYGDKVRNSDVAMFFVTILSWIENNNGTKYFKLPGVLDVFTDDPDMLVSEGFVVH